MSAQQCLFNVLYQYAHQLAEPGQLQLVPAADLFSLMARELPGKCHQSFRNSTLF